jgi:hypothetical protein
MNQYNTNMLDEVRKKLVKEISLLSNDHFNHRPKTGSWSIAQVCHHLVLVENSTSKAVSWGLQKDSRSDVERKNVELSLDRSIKIEAPELVEPAEEPFQVQIIMDMLCEARKNLLGILSKIDDCSVLQERTVKHPVFGALPLDQWVDLVSLHEQRHIEQIQEIKEQLN